MAARHASFGPALDDLEMGWKGDSLGEFADRQLRNGFMRKVFGEFASAWQGLSGLAQGLPQDLPAPGTRQPAALFTSPGSTAGKGRTVSQHGPCQRLDGRGLGRSSWTRTLGVAPPKGAPHSLWPTPCST